MKSKQIFQTTIGGLPITLTKQNKETFTVTYWKQVRDKLNYVEAANELGSCIMHALQCDGSLD